MKIQFRHQEKLTENISTYYFTKPDNFSFIAGQFVELKLPHDADERGEKRWFTISSAPRDDHLSITAKHFDTSSSFKRRLRSMQVGDTAHISEPMGDFVLPRSPSKPLLFIAIGIGITPFMSILRSQALSQEPRNITLLYGAGRRGEFIHKPLFEQTTTANFTTEHITPQMIKSIAETLDKPTIYMAGPEPVVEKLYESLKNELTQSRLLTDYFSNYT